MNAPELSFLLRLRGSRRSARPPQSGPRSAKPPAIMVSIPRMKPLRSELVEGWGFFIICARLTKRNIHFYPSQGNGELLNQRRCSRKSFSYSQTGPCARSRFCKRGISAFHLRMPHMKDLFTIHGLRAHIRIGLHDLTHPLPPFLTHIGTRNRVP